MLRAYSILIGELDSGTEKGYCKALYDGLSCCQEKRHVHVSSDTDYIAKLIGRAEPELTGRSVFGSSYVIVYSLTRNHHQECLIATLTSWINPYRSLPYVCIASYHEDITMNNQLHDQPSNICYTLECVVHT